MRVNQVSTILNKSKRGLLYVGIPILVFIFFVYRFLDYTIYSPGVVAIASQDGKKTAYLLSFGALSGNARLFVSPTKTSNDAFLIGIVSTYELIRFEDLVWSKDSTFVAARCFMEYYARRSELPEDKTIFAYAYDFKLSKRHGGRPSFDAGGLNQWLTRDAKIREMLTARGGMLPILANKKLYHEQKSLNWLEWSRWRKRLGSPALSDSLWEHFLRQIKYK